MGTAMGFWPAARENPDLLALVEPDGAEQTFAELLANANRVVHGLRALGFQAGDTVAAMLPNGAAIVELYLAALQAGWYIVPINYHLTASEVAYILADSDAKAFVGHERLADACRGAVAEASFEDRARFAVGDVRGFRAYEELKAAQPDAPPDDRSTGAVMTYTAGTTGKPKGVRRPTPQVDPDTNGMMNGLFLALFGINPYDDNVHLTVSPLYHTAVVNFTLDSLHLGHTVVLMDKWTPLDTLRLIERYRVTTSHMVPTQFVRLLQLPDDAKAKADVSSLRHMVHSAAPCPVDVKRRMIEWWGPVVDEYYAASEGGGTLATAEQWLKKPGTVGTAWPISQIRVLDESDQPVPAGTPGTVWIRMGDYTFEYHKDAQKTESSWKDGFFTVGDIGYLDDEGFLFLNDRKIDMIISGGVNIYPAEIEGEMIVHPRVADVAVFGVPNDDWGEEVKAVVQPRDGVEPGPELEREILGWCAERLAKYKLPRSIDFVDELPRDPNGKLYKRRLRDPYWAGREKAI
jgi:long-chain acyl-CoA synthetase